MKSLTIPKVASKGDFFVNESLPPAGGEYHPVDCVNWADFPYRPRVCFKVAHTGDSLLLEFVVEEKFTLARITDDNGEVWTDSCVEFFISFDDTGYYNLEVNCIGTALLGFRKEKENGLHADAAVMAAIVRYPSLGREPFRERSVGHPWRLGVEIPAAAFFRHDIRDLSGLRAQGNFYKCGDGLSRPHFLSWNPIDSPAPNFHLEQFFGELIFG